MRALCDAAVDAALAAGSGYADARAIERRAQYVSTRNGQVETVDDSESAGIGVRVLVDGAWGFACDRRLQEEGAREAAGRAVAFARASASLTRRPVELAPLEPASGEYRTPAERDPIEVPLEDKVALCLRAEAGLQARDVLVAEANVRAMRERKTFRSSEGSDFVQEIFECGGGIDVTAVAGGIVQIRSFPSAHGGRSAQAGWEFVESLGLEREAPRIAEEASALLRAAPCP